MGYTYLSSWSGSGAISVAASTTTTGVSFTLTPGVHYPKNARKLHVILTVTDSVVPANTFIETTMEVFVQENPAFKSPTNSPFTPVHVINTTGGTVTRVMRGNGTITIPPNYPDTAATSVTANFTAGATCFFFGSPATLHIHGWDIGP